MCIALSVEDGDNLTDEKIRMNKVVRNNLTLQNRQIPGEGFKLQSQSSF